MSATAAQIQQLRRMVAEPTSTTYSDDAIVVYIERYALLDANGKEPFTLDASTTPPTWEENTSWIPTYDLAAAAADMWAEKAATLAPNFDFNADGASYTRSQAYEQAMKQSRYWGSRRRPVGMVSHMWPEPGNSNTASWLGNAPETD